MKTFVAYIAAAMMAAWLTLTPCRAWAAPADDPFAANACVQCHRDLPGRSSQIVDVEWKHSVHYAAKVGCDGCHGGNASLRREQFSSDLEFKAAAHLERNPDGLVVHRDSGFVSAARGRAVSYLCGKCHMAIKEQHLGSPHGEFGDPSCLYCHGHGSHAITNPSLQIIDLRKREDEGRCRVCHRAGTMEAVSKIKQTLTATEDRIKISGDQYKLLESWGYRNLELEKLHHHADEVRSQIRQIFHSLNMREISNFAGEVDAVADRTTASFELVQRLRHTQRQQTTVGLLVVTFLLAFAGMLIYYKNSILGHGPAVDTTLPRTAQITLPTSPPTTPPTKPPTTPPTTPVASDTVETASLRETAREANPPASPSPATPAEGRRPGMLVAVGIVLSIVHFVGTLIWLVLAFFLDRPDSAVGTVHHAIGELFRWPILWPVMHQKAAPFLLWPALLANSALWGFAAAALGVALVRCRAILMRTR